MKLTRSFVIISWACFLLAVNHMAFGQDCSDSQKEVIVEITADNYPNETSWTLTDQAGNLLAEGLIDGDTLCVDTNLCLIFNILDSYGDGICCGFGEGSYSVTFDGIEVASGGEFNHSESTAFNCTPGFTCANAVEVQPGDYIALHNDYWYAFSPDTTGIYTVTTCETNTCDTKIWIYDLCEGVFLSDDNAGTIYFNDNEGDCGLQADVSAYLEAGITYYIRIGSSDGDCEGAINWSLLFGGEIEGCMDSEACNFNPLANEDDGSCIYAGDPGCSGPDLWALEDVLRNSLYADVINNSNDNCLINEGCVQGFGQREVARFTTHIKNIGDLDYYIGRPSDNPDQFSYDNCHGHQHYEGYAEYRLINEDNQLLPVGFKNGFCVIDLECDGGGTPKYGCGNMGITAGCGDYYTSGLQCQWVDLTGLPEGDYTLVVTVNWDRSPDALGRYETDYDNNWAQACFNLSRNEGGHQVTLLPQCDVVVDCEGTPFGNAEYDCMGECGGEALYGDLNGDVIQNTTDATSYIYDIIHGGLDASPCFDLDANGTISVYDAALVNSCYLYGSGHNHPDGGNIHDHCNLPGGVINPLHTATLSIIAADFDNGTVDIGINNPNDHITAYEFNMSGLEIESVESLVDASLFPITPDYVVGGNKIIGISLVDSIIPKGNGTYQPLCRITFSSTSGTEICIDTIVDIINDLTHKVNTEIVNGCTDIISGVRNIYNNHRLSIYPNPSDGQIRLSYKLDESEDVQIEVANQLGQPVLEMNLESNREDQIWLDLSGEEAGIYLVKFKTSSGITTRKVILAR